MLKRKAKEYLRIERFLSSYCPGIKNVKHKLRGIDGNKKPIDFTETEMVEIDKALRQLCADLIA